MFDIPYNCVRDLNAGQSERFHSHFFVDFLFTQDIHSKKCH